jgi:hypothetical protein
MKKYKDMVRELKNSNKLAQYQEDKIAALIAENAQLKFNYDCEYQNRIYYFNRGLNFEDKNKELRDTLKVERDAVADWKANYEELDEQNSALKADCERLQKGLAAFEGMAFSDNQQITKLKAENKELRKALEDTMESFPKDLRHHTLAYRVLVKYKKEGE